jgi:hypothetical protein
MQKCKYLDDLNIPINEYGTNFISDYHDCRAKSWFKEREEYGFDNRETWNLDRIFIEWIYTRVMMYKEHCLVDLDYYKFTYKDLEYTQGGVIDKILELAKEILLDTDNDELFYNNSREICDLWKEVLPYMWW